MLKIEKTVLMSPEQYEIVIEGMRNPMNSWNLMDSYATHIEDPETLQTELSEYFIGDNDLKLMKNLAVGGSVHAKYRRMMPVWVTLTAPLYWWKEFDTYKIGTVANSCSTMHKIHEKEFIRDDFSHEHLMDMTEIDGFSWDNYPMYADERWSPDLLFDMTIKMINFYRKKYLETDAKINDPVGDWGDKQVLAEERKKYWWQMIQLLPTSYNQKRTIFLNYEVLVGIYSSRRDHKLTEWHTFCDWIEGLPYSDLITKR